MQERPQAPCKICGRQCEHVPQDHFPEWHCPRCGSFEYVTTLGWLDLTTSDDKVQMAGCSRLMLIETISFTTTPEDMLDSLTWIIADRAVGGLFFGNTADMDFELMGGDARDAMVAEAGERGMTPFLPPKVPFGSKQWPTLITPGPGPASLAELH